MDWQLAESIETVAAVEEPVREISAESEQFGSCRRRLTAGKCASAAGFLDLFLYHHLARGVYIKLASNKYSSLTDIVSRQNGC